MSFKLRDWGLVAALVLALPLFRAMNRYQPVDEFRWLWMSALGALVIAVSLALSPAGRAWARRGVSPDAPYPGAAHALVWLMIWGFPAVALAVILPLVNGIADASPERCFERKVLSRYSGGMRTLPQVVVESWRPGRVDESIHVSTGKKPPKSLRVCVKSGHLGIEWVSDVERVD